MKVTVKQRHKGEVPVMFTQTATDFAGRWFDALNASDRSAALALFDDDPTIKNAAFPETKGSAAAPDLIDGFFDRTSDRRFTLLSAAEGERFTFAECLAELEFRPGVTVAGIRIERPTSVMFSGVEIFGLNDTGLINTLNIVHETTRIARAASGEQLPPLSMASLEARSTTVLTNPEARTLVEDYLRGEEEGDLARIEQHFAPVHTITNAAVPAVTSDSALREFCESFWSRTSNRRFDLIDTAVSPGRVFAFCAGTIGFKEGAAFGPVTAIRDFEVSLPVGLVFGIDGDGRVESLHVHHETTTAARLAAVTE